MKFVLVPQRLGMISVDTLGGLFDAERSAPEGEWSLEDDTFGRVVFKQPWPSPRKLIRTE